MDREPPGFEPATRARRGGFAALVLVMGIGRLLTAHPGSSGQARTPATPGPRAERAVGFYDEHLQRVAALAADPALSTFTPFN